METLGFVGLGNMGMPIATNLLKAGYQLIVSDIRPEVTAELIRHGVAASVSVCDLADSVEVVFISLPTPSIVESVVMGEHGLGYGSKLRSIVNLSTTGTPLSLKLNAMLQLRRIEWVDAPVSGGVDGAKAGQLTLMVSGSSIAFCRVLPILEVMGKVVNVGERPGLGQTMKLVNNILSGGALVLTAEAMVLGAKAGLSADVMIEVLNSGSGRNTGTADKFPKSVLTGRFDYGFAASLMAKDNKLFVDEAVANGLSLTVATAVSKMWVELINELGDGDFTTIARLMELRAGVELRTALQV